MNHKHGHLKLRDHQIAALDYLEKSYASLLDMSMGAGKTLIVLEHILRHPEYKKILIVCPLVVINVWKEEIKKWGFNSHVSIKAPGENIVITNYESVWRGKFGKWAARQKWNLVVADECQKIRNAGSRVSKYFVGLGRIAGKRISMSGTPIGNNCLDAFGIYRFLDMGLFCQAYTRFEHKYAILIEKESYNVVAGYKNQDDFQNCYDFLRFRVGPEVLDLPPVSYSTIKVELPEEARELYDHFDKDFVAHLQGKAMSAPNVLVKLLRLQGITSGIIKLDKEEPQVLHNAKGEALKELLEGLAEPVVVFGRYRHDLVVCENVCKELGLHYSEISGNRKELERWIDVLGVQIKAGTTGIDLTKASIAIFLSTGYSYDDLEQTIARLVRPPQSKPVRIIYIECVKTIDQKVRKALQTKRNLIKALQEVG